MEKLRLSFILLLLAITGVIANGQSVSNKLTVPDVTVQKGKYFQIPVQMVNSSQIVALQFDLVYPEDVNLSTYVGLTERSENHTITAKKVGGNTLRVVSYSPDNSPFIGSAGDLIYIEASVPYTTEEGEYDFELKNVVLGLATGENVVTEFKAGKLIIGNSPDLVVENVTITPAALNPGETLKITWKVSNIGGADMQNGFNESIYLFNDEGSKYIGSTYYNAGLVAGSSVNREFEEQISSTLGLSGEVKAKVVVSPTAYNDEPGSAQSNNTAQSEGTVTLGQLLSLSMTSEINENYVTRLYGWVSRSGSVKNAETFTLTKTKGDARMTVPSTVTIEAGNASARFNVDINDDNILNDSDDFEFTISAPGYETYTHKLTIIDDERPQLTVTASKDEIVEGDSLVLTIVSQRALLEDAMLKISCDAAKRFDFPRTVTLPAGQISIDVTIKSIDNADVDETEVYAQFNVTGDAVEADDAVVTIKDNDMPDIALSLTTETVNEYSGPRAIKAILTRTGNLNNKVTIKFSDSSNGRLSYDKSLTMDRYVDRIEFYIGVVDNQIVDGDEDVEFQAAVYVQSCSCTAPSHTGGTVTKTIHINDNDGPTIRVKAANATWIEGSTQNVTVSRNTSTAEALTVTISSNADDKLVYDKTVTIPAGAESATFTVQVKSNDVSGDDITFVLQASAEGYSKGSTVVMISDQTLPDAIVSALTVEKSEVGVTGEITITATIKNIGVSAVPELTTVDVYYDNNSTALFTMWTQEAIAPGATTTVTKTFTEEMGVGQHNLWANVNRGMKFTEISYDNNMSEYVPITILPGYSATISVDKTKMASGEPLTITGKAEGTLAANAEVEIYLINKVREKFTTTTDAAGNFEYVWTPFDRQAGRFIVGACYPGLNSTDQQAVVDVAGLDVAINKTGVEPAATEEFNGSFTVTNNGSLRLTDIVVSPVDLPDYVQATVTTNGNIAALDPGESVTVYYTVVGSDVTPGSDWDKIYFQAVSGNVKGKDYLKYYCHPLLAKMQLDQKSLDVTVTKGSSRECTIKLTNVGKGETGEIAMAITAPWIKALTPMTMPSLAKGESTDIILSLNGDDFQLNVQQTATIGINCAKGDGLPFQVRMTPVSDEKGRLTIDVCDQYTYRTEEAPHVAGAKVTIKNPSTNKLIGEGTTDANGIFSMELSEGYYAVTVEAPDHETYNNNLVVNPGRETNKIVNLGYTGGVTITYTVQEVEGGIEDQYDITTTVVFETQVPVPVVVIDGPDHINIDDMAIGESQLVYFTATNKGLITALNFTLELPDGGGEYEWTPMTDIGPMDIAPQQSVLLPLLFTRLAEPTIDENGNPINHVVARGAIDVGRNCMSTLRYLYEDQCGEELKKNEGANKLALRMCAMAAIVSHFGGSGAAGVGPGGNGIGPAWAGNEVLVIGEPARSICDECVAELAESIITVLVSKAIGDYGDGVDMAYTGHELAYEKAYDGKVSGKTIVETGANLVGKVKKEFGEKMGYVTDVITVYQWMYKGSNCFGNRAGTPAPPAPPRPNVGVPAPPTLGSPLAAPQNPAIQRAPAISPELAAWYESIEHFYDNNPAWDEETGLTNFNPDLHKGIPSWLTSNGQIMYDLGTYINLWAYIEIEIHGSEAWTKEYDETMGFFYDKLKATPEKEWTYDNLKNYKPQSVSDEDFRLYIERLYNTEFDIESDNRIDLDYIDQCVNRITIMDAYAHTNGYENFIDMAVAANDDINRNLDEAESTVCATVTLQFKQKMVMTRQGFRGTLTVYNGHDELPMEDVVLNLEVYDPEGHAATKHEMSIVLEDVDKFTDKTLVTDNVEWKLGTVGAKETAEATILYIPTKYAAPDKPVNYWFQGTLTYKDPYNGMVVTEDFTPTMLTVNPSPDLDLVYFMQRNVMGDDPLTEEVEPIVPAEFSLLINNIGNGDATNVKISTEQPEIIDNEKGLLIDFELLYSVLNGQETSMPIGGTVITDFGDIPAKSSAFAQWYFTSTLMGHFNSYDVEATHVNSYDNPDLSLLNEVTIHELIQSVKYGPAANQVAFLVNDINDVNDTPDHLYLSDGTIKEVEYISGSSLERQSDLVYKLTVTPTKGGWNYGKVNDPMGGRSTIEKITRVRDGADIDLKNFWLTHATMRDSKKPFYENLMHFADDMVSSGVEEYLIQFAPRPSETLKVEGFRLIPETMPLFEPLDTVGVLFNKPIDPKTFTTDAIRLAIQGKNVDVSEVEILQETLDYYLLDLSQVNTGNGYYVLTIMTNEITDWEGFNGTVGYKADWVQFAGGKANLTVNAIPAEGGEVSPKSGALQYDSQVTLKAQAAEGYEFVGWLYNDEIVSTAAEYLIKIDGDLEYTAQFRRLQYTVAIDYDAAGGSVSGFTPGMYYYGTNVTLKAEANDGWHFDGWLVNDEPYSADKDLNAPLKENATFTAVFSNNCRTIDYEFATGWHWMTPIFADADLQDPMQFLAPYKANVLRLVGRGEELVQDPEYGLVGNLKALSPGQSYKIQLQNASEGSLTGHITVPEDYVITINRGWNWLGYVPTVELSLDEAFEILEPEQDDIVKGFEAFATYTDGKWVGTLKTMKPGEGYQYYSGKIGDFAYPAVSVFNTHVSAPAGMPSLSIAPWSVDSHRYPDNVTVIATLDDNNRDVYTIGAFVGNECRGIGECINGRIFLTVHGSSSDRHIDLRAYDAANDEEWSIEEYLDFADSHAGTYSSPKVLHLGSMLGIASVDADVDFNVYPNPVRDVLYINGNVDSIEHVKIIGMSGVTFYSANWYNADAGIEVSSLAQGFYFIEIGANGQSIVKRFVKK